MTLRRYIILIGLVFSALLPYAAQAQSYLETFGQNRIQYRKFKWKFFDTKHFRIYFYDQAGRDLARYVSEEAEKDIVAVEKKMGGQFPKRFNIILYNNFDEYRQNNIGLKYDGQIVDIQNAGSVDLVGDKLVVYFTGQHVDLRHQIRAGMAHVVMERMIFGENLRKMVKNALLLNLPPWVTAGFISYIVDGWDTKTNSDWKNLLAGRPKADFNTLSDQYPELAGKAFWEFMSINYGSGSIKRLLFTMEDKSNLNQGMKIVLGMKVRKAYDSCLVYFRKVYATDALHEEQPDSVAGLIKVKVPKDNTVLRSIKVAPRGHDIAYVTWLNGEYQVYIQHTAKEQANTLLLEGGRKDYNDIIDPNYPLLAWSNNGYLLAIAYRKNNKTLLKIYNSLKARITTYAIPTNRVDRILGMTFMEDDNFMLFSGIKKSQTDLFEYNLRRSRITNITNDRWDDLDPCFVSGGSRKGIVFVSNRTKPNLDVPLQVNELPTGPMNVFFYNTTTKRPELLQCTNVKTGHIIQPIQYGPDNFSYLYDENGIWNKYVVMFARDKYNMDSAYSLPITNYSENILSHQYNPASDQVADVLQQGGEYKVFFQKPKYPGADAAIKKLEPTTLFKAEQAKKEEEPTSNLQYDPGKNAYTEQADNEEETPENNIRHESNPFVIKKGSTFQTEFTDTTAPVVEDRRTAREKRREERRLQAADSSTLMVINDSTYLKMKAAPYRLSFKPDFLTVRLDNSILFSQYQSYQNSGGQFSNPSLSGLITLSLNDLMENHRFTGGFQLPFNFSGLTYFLQYENFESRIDWGLLYLHTQNLYNYPVLYTDSAGVPLFQKTQLGKTVTNMVQFSATYPFDHVRSLRFHTALREDALRFKAQDSLGLYDIPNNIQYWSLSRLEYVFDNTTNPILNIREGFRYKAYVEYMYNIKTAAQNCYNIGFDFRYYKKLYKNFIWATRVAGAHSEGNYKVVYYLGGVDNWFNPQYSDYVPVSGGPYGFQALATSLRGYYQNARNGNTFALANTEFRLPVFSTFLKRPVQSSLLKNMQLVAFADIGSAWNGLFSTTDNNSQYVFPQPGVPGNVIVSLNIPNNNGFGLGYGVGMRTMVVGYFLRLDAAWNIEGIRKPIWYFSMGTDF